MYNLLHDLLMQCISLLKICLLSIFAGKHSCANVQRWLKHSLVPWIWFTMREVSWKNSFIRNKATGSIWCKVQFIFMCFCNLKGRIISHYRLLYIVLWKWAIAHAIYAKKEFKTNTEGWREILRKQQFEAITVFFHESGVYCLNWLNM